MLFSLVAKIPVRFYGYNKLDLCNSSMNNINWTTQCVTCLGTRGLQVGAEVGGRGLKPCRPIAGDRGEEGRRAQRKEMRD